MKNLRKLYEMKDFDHWDDLHQNEESFRRFPKIRNSGGSGNERGEKNNHSFKKERLR